MKTSTRFLVLLGAVLAPLWASAQVQVIISGGFSGPYDRLLPAFERATGLRVNTGSGASQGNGPQTIAAQLARGVPADVVILSRQGLEQLMEAGRIATGTTQRDAAQRLIAFLVSPEAASEIAKSGMEPLGRRP